MLIEGEEFIIFLERLLMAFTVVSLYALAIYVVYQTKSLVIRSCRTPSTNLITIVGITVFFILPLNMNRTLMDPMVIFLLPVLIIFGCFPHNRGLTEHGMYKFGRLAYMTSLIGSFIPFDRTQNWVIYEEENSLSVKVTVVYGDIRYHISFLDFDSLKNYQEQEVMLNFSKEKKKEIIELLGDQGCREERTSTCRGRRIIESLKGEFYLNLDVKTVLVILGLIYFYSLATVLVIRYFKTIIRSCVSNFTKIVNVAFGVFVILFPYFQTRVPLSTYLIITLPITISIMVAPFSRGLRKDGAIIFKRPKFSKDVSSLLGKFVAYEDTDNWTLIEEENSLILRFFVKQLKKANKKELSFKKEHKKEILDFLARRDLTVRLVDKDASQSC